MKLRQTKLVAAEVLLKNIFQKVFGKNDSSSQNKLETGVECLKKTEPKKAWFSKFWDFIKLSIYYLL